MSIQNSSLLRYVALSVLLLSTPPAANANPVGCAAIYDSDSAELIAKLAEKGYSTTSIQDIPGIVEARALLDELAATRAQWRKEIREAQDRLDESRDGGYDEEDMGVISRRQDAIAKIDAMSDEVADTITKKVDEAASVQNAGLVTFRVAYTPSRENGVVMYAVDSLHSGILRGVPFQKSGIEKAKRLERRVVPRALAELERLIPDCPSH